MDAVRRFSGVRHHPSAKRQASPMQEKNNKKEEQS
jgi:hypothetical protein